MDARHGIFKSLASFMPRAFQRIPLFYIGKFYYKASSNGLVLIEQILLNGCFVGNPVLQQWVKIPPSPVDSLWCCLVTRVDEDGVVLSFKVVRLSKKQVSNDYVSDTLSVSLYSSETGIWTWKQIHCPYQITDLSSMTLNGTIYFCSLSKPGVFVAHDFYSESDRFRVVHYPDDSRDNRALTTSGGFVMYVRTLYQKEETVFKVWRLNNDDSWQLLWEIGIPDIGNYYVPMAMHPFDSGFVYLVSLENRHFMSCNLRTQNYRILRDGYNDDHQDYFVDQSVCDKYIDEKWGPGSSPMNYGASFLVLQSVLPWWMESVPRPPKVEIINTASLLSEITSMEKARKMNGGDGYV